MTQNPSTPEVVGEATHPGRLREEPSTTPEGEGLEQAIREVETLEIMLDFVAEYGPDGVPFATQNNAVTLRDSVHRVLAALASSEARLQALIAEGEEMKATVKALSRYQPPSELLRTVAVTEVDCKYGFTCEFAPSPSAQVEEYALVEENLKAALRAGLAGTYIADRLDDDLTAQASLTALRKEVGAFLKRHDELAGDLEGFFILANAKGIKWTAGNWKDELEALRAAALSKLEERL